MTKYIKCGGGGLPPQVITDMNAVLNKKFGTSTDYPSSSWPSNIEKMTALPEESASGSIAHFEDGADTVPLKTAIFNFTPTQAQGTPTPSNPLPITGHTGLNVVHAGANIWDEEYLNGYYSSTGAYTYNAGQLCTKNKIDVVPNATYRLVLANLTGNQGQAICFYQKDGTFISRILNVYEFTTPSHCYQVNVNFGSNYGGTYNDDISVNYPSTDTDYHPYTTATTYPISWTDTVYGGYVNEKGEVWATQKDVDMGSLSWTYTNGIFRGIITDGVILSQANVIDFYCEIYLVKGSGSSGKWTSDNLVCWHGTGSSCYIYVNDTNYNDADVFKTAVTGHKLVYGLATPVKIATIDPIVINSALGVNNVWNDGGGDTSLTYRADIDLYVAEHS